MLYGIKANGITCFPTWQYIHMKLVWSCNRTDHYGVGYARLAIEAYRNQFTQTAPVWN